MNYVFQTVKRLIHAAGFDVGRLTTKTNPAYQLYRGLQHFNVDLVFDVGANIGQFASELRSVGYKGDIVSFEPLSDAHKSLSACAKGDAKWQVHERTAIGDFDGEVEINVSGNSVSSSVLPMTEAHSAAAADSAYVSSEKVSIAMLDTIASRYVSKANRFFIKIDTQGFESQVLDGAQETLTQAQGLLCELSLVQLYKGQLLWLDLIKRIESAGFTLWSIQRGFTDPRDGRTLQINAIFFRQTNIGCLGKSV